MKAHGKHEKGNGKGHTVADAKKDKKKAKVSLITTTSKVVFQEPKAATPTVEVHIVSDHAETVHKDEHGHKHAAKHDKHHDHAHAHTHAHGHADAVHDGRGRFQYFPQM